MTSMTSPGQRKKDRIDALAEAGTLSDEEGVSLWRSAWRRLRRDPVFLVGAVIIGFGVGRIVKAFTKSFNDVLETTLTGAGEKFAQAGYAAKGVALAGVGGLFIWAALTHDSSRAGGLDQAIQTFLGFPFGPWLVSALALGIGQFGLYCFYWAMHAKHA